MGCRQIDDRGYVAVGINESRTLDLFDPVVRDADELNYGKPVSPVETLTPLGVGAAYS